MEIESRIKLKYVVTLALLVIAITLFSVVSVFAATHATLNGSITVTYAAPSYILKTGAEINEIIPDDCQTIVFGDSDNTLYSHILTDSAYTATDVTANNSGCIKFYYKNGASPAYFLADSTIIFNEDSASMFEGKNNLASLTLNNINTERTLYMNNMFNGCSELRALNVDSFSTREVVDMSSMFRGCSELTSLRLSDFETPFVEDMNNMFNGCTNLTSLDLSNFNTSNVEDMGSMFSDCSSLTSVDLSSFNTSKVTEMSHMFNDCSALTSLDLFSFNTGNLMGTDSMFEECSALQTIIVGDYWSFGNVQSNQGMFYHCTSLVGGNGTRYDSSYQHGERAVPDTSEKQGYLTIKSELVPTSTLSSVIPSDCKDVIFDKKKPHAIAGELDNCNSGYYNLLTKHQVQGNEPYIELYYNTNTKTAYILAEGIMIFPDDCSYMFEARSTLETVEFVNGLDTTKMTNITGMFAECGALQSTSFSDEFNTGNVTKMNNLFLDCENLNSITFGDNFNTSAVTSMAAMFDNCKSLTSLDLSGFNTNQVSYMQYMFRRCGNLTALDLTSFNTSKVTNMTEMFNQCLELQTIAVGSNWSTNKATSSSNMFTGCLELSGKYGTDYNVSNLTKTYAVIDTTTTDGYLSDSISVEYYVRSLPDTITTIVFGSASGYDSIVNNSSYTKKEIQTGLTEYVNSAKTEAYYLSNNTINLNNCYKLFYQKSNLQSVDFGNTNTSNTKNMSYMFGYCSNLTSEESDLLNTSNVRNMRYMFAGCVALPSVDVEGFNTYKVTNMGAMFQNCSKLTDIGRNFTASVVTNTSYMFYGCSSLSGLDLSNFDTGKVTDMRYMFYGCSSLSGLVLSSYYTSKVTNMEYMFNGCSALTCLDLSAFNTSKVTDMTNLFNGCSKLITIAVGTTWSTSNVTSHSNMFTGCAELSGKYGANIYNSSDVTKTYAVIDTTTTDGYLSDSIAIDYYVKTLPSSIKTIVFGKASSYTSIVNSSSYTKREIQTGLTEYVSSDKTKAYYLSNSKISILNGYSLFYKRSSLTSINFTNAEVKDTKYTRFMFTNCSNLTSLDLSNFDTSNVTNMNHMFSGCSKLTEIGTGLESSAVATNLSYMFSGCSGLLSVNLDNFNTSNVTNMSYMFYNCTSLKTVYVTDSWSTSKVSSHSNMFTNCKKLVGGYGTSFSDTSSSINKTYAKADTLSSKGYFVGEEVALCIDFVDRLPVETEYIYFTTKSYASSYTKKGSLFAYDHDFTSDYNYVECYYSGTNIYIVSDRKIALPNKIAMFKNQIGLSGITFANVYLENVTSMKSWFQGCTELDYVEFDDVGISTSVTDMSYMFYECFYLMRVNFNGLDTSKVTNMSYMFYRCPSLGYYAGTGNYFALDIDTSRVINMSFMFFECTEIKTLDLSSFNTSNVTNMSYMFFGCAELVTIYVGSNWSNAFAATSTDMFAWCEELVGGNGTTYNSDYIDKTYARVDTATTPGYLTLKTN